jgi:hypothetical protein
VSCTLAGMWKSLALAASLALATAVPSEPPTPTQAREFVRSPVNAFGASSLADFRGKPVFVDFWGTR